MNREYLLTLPEVLTAKSAGFSSNDIAEYLESKHNIIISPTSIRTLISQHNKNNIIPKFAKNLIYFYPDDQSIDISEYSNIIHGLFYTFKSLNSTDKIIPDSWLITEQNLKQKIINPVGRIYAKWFLQLFHISNTQLLSDLIVNEDQLKLITLVPSTIDDTYDKILRELKLKYMDYLSIKMKG